MKSSNLYTYNPCNFVLFSAEDITAFYSKMDAEDEDDEEEGGSSSKKVVSFEVKFHVSAVNLH